MNRNPKTKFKKGHIPWNKGKKGLQKHSEETKKKLSQIRKGKPKPWQKGKKLPLEHRRKMSEAHKGKYKGNENPNWRGGTSFEPYSSAWTKELRQAIRQRDNFTCQVCKKYPAFACHHIDYDKKNCEPENLITLCYSCHTKTNFNRQSWINYFRKLAESPLSALALK